MTKINILTELIATLADTLRHGDLTGHLHAWWQIATRAHAIGQE